MTAAEFKTLKPEYKDAEGEVLWNAMENYMLTQQAGQEVMKTAMPFFKRYQLRWVFYRKLPNMVSQKDNYTSKERCSKCKHPVGMKMGMAYNGSFHFWCLNCREELIEEPNTNLDHRLFLIWRYIPISFWWLLNKIHLVRSTYGGRYDMMGEESKYVRHWTFNTESGEITRVLRSRKWWEYIFIERSQFKF